MAEILELPATPSAGRVVAFDLERVDVDLRSVPIDEVLSLRQDYSEQHRQHARSVRKFVLDPSMLPEEERAREFEERQRELNDMARDLKSVGRKAWKRPAWFALTAAGAAWTAYTGDPMAAILGACAGVLAANSRERVETAASAYIFTAKQQFLY